MTYQQPIRVETETEHAVKQALVLLQLVLLFVLVGYVVLFLWNACTYLLHVRSIFRRIDYGRWSWIGGLWIGLGVSFPFTAQEHRPEMWGGWLIIVPFVVFGVLWLETVGLREHQRQLMMAQMQGEGEDQ